MKVYKFRQLQSCKDLCRIKEIIKTGKFWCSNFSDLNDSMEGVYIAKNEDIVHKIFNQKNTYKICSFSGQKGFENPAMWGYYAGGFHGVAIEVEIDEHKIEKVKYTCNTIASGDVKDILTSKLKCWEHEDEYRYLDNTKHNSVEIGETTKVYFGNPYVGLKNTEKIEQNNKNLTKYKGFREELKEFLNLPELKHIESFDVKVENNKVIRVG